MINLIKTNRLFYFWSDVSIYYVDKTRTTGKSCSHEREQVASAPPTHMDKILTFSTGFDEVERISTRVRERAYRRRLVISALCKMRCK